MEISSTIIETIIDNKSEKTVLNLYWLCALKITLEFPQKWDQQGIKNQEKTLLHQCYFFLFVTVFFKMTLSVR